MIQQLADKITEVQKDSPVLVGIDGIDASGKTTLADELADELKKSNREIIRASIDGFHNSEKIRYSKGQNSPEGYYFDSFNYKSVQEFLLNPLHSGDLKYKPVAFDYLNNRDVVSNCIEATRNAILIMDGIFLFRPELIKYWDLKIFLDIDFKVVTQRAIKRLAEKKHIGSKEDILDKYNKRYILGQKIYLGNEEPRKKADIIIDNNNFENPVYRENFF
jgi:uridine kinase